jgi:hypothetical protein
MGHEKYGDCIFIRYGEVNVLIDGGHLKDSQSSEGMESIPDQLADILGTSPPFEIDLLVITHCHADHIGCLPDLVKNKIIEVKWAFLPDEKLGFGHVDDDAAIDVASPEYRIAALLREEDHSSLSDEELEEFVSDAIKLETRYNQMIEDLKKTKVNIVRFGRDSNKQIEDAFRQIGLKVLGPSPEQFKCCAEAIAQLNNNSKHYAKDISDADDISAHISLYRRLLSDSDALPAGAQDRPGKGAAFNCQSILLGLDTGDGTALLTGDMQFASPEISGITSMMSTLRKIVSDAGPYSFIKLPHHGSYNGFDDSVMKEWESTKVYGISGGQNDPDHPDPGVLKLLEEYTNSITWGRTDHNGMITVNFLNSEAGLNVKRGKLNDAISNSDAVPEPHPSVKKQAIPAGMGKGITVTCDKGDLSLSEVFWKPTGVSLDFTLPGEESARKDISLGPKASGVSAGTKSITDISWSNLRLGGGRNLPPLLFITNMKRLENNLGVQEANAVVKLIRDARQTLYDVRNPVSPFPEVKARLSEGRYKGVVIVGGYDVIPSQRLDTIPPSIRNGVGASTSDADNFIVWCDDIYGDFKGDALPDLPVSRVPDAKSPKLVMAALTSAPPSPVKDRFGVRNLARPFANGIFSLLPGSTNILVSEPATPANIGQGRAAHDSVYFMLHGSDTDGSRFWGETNQGGILEAANVTNVPQRLSGVVFSGCCWGALTVQTTALRASSGVQLGIRTTGTSMAINYLHAGALAYIGCTGTHYSPTVAPYNYFGGPMHTAFWKHYLKGESPAQALFSAKLDYLQGMPHGQTSMIGQAIEFKILKQFTCLGLGW